MPLSLLALGPGGWVQTVNFNFTGLLFVLGGAGLAIAGPGGWTKAAGVALAVQGIGLIVAGLNPAPPSMNFPPGAPMLPDEPLPRSAQMHGLGFTVAGIGFILFVLAAAAALWAAGASGGAMVAVGAGVLAPVLIAAGMSSVDLASRAFFGFAIIEMSAVTVLVGYFYRLLA